MGTFQTSYEILKYKYRVQKVQRVVEIETNRKILRITQPVIDICTRN